MRVTYLLSAALIFTISACTTTQFKNTGQPIYNGACEQQCRDSTIQVQDQMACIQQCSHR